MLILMALIWGAPAVAQQLGHKVLGSLGLLAGSQPDSGLYVISEFADYGSNEVHDSDGHKIPLALNLTAWASPVGVQYTFKLPGHSLYMNVSAAAPISQVSLQTGEPLASVDEFGFGDVYVQPAKIGWKSRRLDLVAGYAFYAPSGLYAPHASGSVGLGQWSHEFSLGSAVYFDHAKTWNISGLASYTLNQRKQGIDITRGDSIQFQGGAGKTFLLPGKPLPRVDVGLAGYGLWQVRDNRGSDLPAVLHNARDVDLGLGPELDLTIAPIRSMITVRYCRDVVAKARPLGHILVIGLTIVARR
jgi:hypothetical protein